MKLKAKKLGLKTGDVSVVVVDDDDAFRMGLKPGDRVIVYLIHEDGSLSKGKHAVMDYSTNDGIITQGEVGFYDEVWDSLGLENDGRQIMLQPSAKPESFEAIKNKIEGKELSKHEIYAIIRDATENRILPIEIAAFITGLEINGATDKEVVHLTEAMAQSGEILDFGNEVYDKHSTGGVPGNKVSLLIVPVIAAAGLFIPKTSTRAITSPSGTADSFEVLAQVAFSKDELVNILNTNKAGILWGGALDLAPADNALIRIEKPLSMDPFPLMIASIICKKLAMGVKKLVLDIPCGKGTKFPTPADGKKYAIRFKKIARKVGIDATCLLTSASQPIGHAVGPALEAREGLKLLINPDGGPSSLLNKSCELAGILLEMAGISKLGEGKLKAMEILKSGKAYEAMKKIINAQNGDPEIKPEDIKVGPHVAKIEAEEDGFVTEVENKFINRIAKIAGCPAAKKAGIEIGQKIGQQVYKGDVIFKIFAPSEEKLQEALDYYQNHKPQIMGGMTIEKV